MQRRLNLIFLAGFLAVTTALGATAWAVQRYQVRHHLDKVLDRARKTEDAGELDKTIEYLRRYLSVRPLDGEVWAWLARVMDRKTPKEPDRVHPGRMQVYEALAQATRLRPDDAPVRRQCIALAMEQGRYADARRHLKILLEPVKERADDSVAELEDLLGQCDQGENKAREAGEWYEKAIRNDPGRVDAADRYARLLRDALKQPEKADPVIAKMVELNPRSARAYLNRWRYLKDYGPKADDQDVARALERGPDDADVLLAAAELAIGRDERALARRHIEHGLDLYVKNATFYVLAASLATKENRPDEAETVLRRGIEAVPSNAQLPFLLADLLISQRALDGPDGADSWLTRLTDRRLSDGLLKYLGARLAVARQQWEEAKSKLKTARTLLASDPVLSGKLNSMLAECLGRTGDEEGRLVALRRATESPEQSVAVTAQLGLAQGLEAVGQFDEAQNQFILVAKAVPEARLDVARLAILKTSRLPRTKRRWGEAERRVKDAEAGAPGDGVGLALMKTELLTSQERFDQARQVIESALESRRKDARLWAALARIVQLQGQWPQALKILDQADKELGPRLELSLARMSTWSRRGGDEARSALTGLAGAISRFPAEDQIRLRDVLATAWLRLGDAQRARAAWRELLDQQPDNLRVLSNLGDLAIDAGDHAEARQLLSRLRKIEGEEGTHWRFAEVAILIDFARRGDTSALAKAQPLVSEIALRRSDWWGVPVLRAQIAEVEGRLDDAVKHYQDAIRMGNSQLYVARRLVGLLEQLQQFDQIGALVEALAARGLETEDLTLATAVAALRKGDFDRAVAVARQTLPETSKSPRDHLALGRILLAAGRTDEAGRELKLAVDRGPGIPGTWLAYVAYLVQVKQTEQARAAIDAARKALPAPLAAATLAQCHALIGNIKEAEANYQAALAVLPADPTLLRLAADFHLKHNQKAKAQPLLEKLLDPATGASSGDLAWAHRARGLVQIDAGSTAGIDRAIEAVNENLRANPYSIDDKRIRAILLAARPGRRGEAIDDLQKRDQTLDADQRFLLALLYLAENDREKSEQQLNKLIDGSGSTKDPNHLAVLIQVQLDQNKFKEAGPWLADLKRLEPHSGRAVELEATLLKAQKRESDLLALLRTYGSDPAAGKATVAALFDRFGFPDDAERAYREAVAENPRAPELLGRLTQFLGRRNRAGEALSLWAQARQDLSPELAADVGVSVVTHPSASEVQREEVASWLAQTLKAQPDNVALRLKLAFLRLRQDRREESQSLYRQVLADSPENIEALNNLASLIAFQHGLGDEALSLIDKAVALGSGAPGLLDTRAMVYLQTGQTNRAYADLRRALAISPKLTVAYFHLARAYHQDKNEAEAKKAFAQADRLGLKREDVDPVERDEYDRLRRQLMEH
jgi:tetratricopeptide (TPR) repeat protein